jgi:hypothetical protein
MLKINLKKIINLYLGQLKINRLINLANIKSSNVLKMALPIRSNHTKVNLRI